MQEDKSRTNGNKDNMEKPPPDARSELVKSEKDQRVFYNPVDRGWSWVILVCLFLSYVLVLGVLSAFGVLFVPIQTKFNAEASAVSLIPGVQGAIFSVSCFVAMMILMTVMSVRNIVRLGALLASVGLSLCFLADSVLFLCISQALMCGVGFAMCYGPGFVLLGSYFDKRRAMALAIANTGGSVGTLLLPLLISKLLEEYSLAGTYLLLGGVIAQNVVIASFLTPPSDYKPRRKNNRLDTDAAATRALLDSEDSESKQVVYDEGESGANDEEENRSETKTIISRTFSESQKIQVVTFSDDSKVLSPKPQPFTYRRQFSEGNRPEFQAQKTMASQVSSDSNLSVLYLSCEVIYYPPPDLASIRPAETDEVSERELGELDCKPRNRVNQCLLSCFDPALVKCPLLWLLLAFIFFGVYGVVMPTAFLPPLAIEKGLSTLEAAFLLTVVGSLDIVSRLVPGFVAQMKWLKPQTMVCIANLILGTAFQLTPFLNSWEAMMGLAIVVGLFGGIFVSMMQLITIEFVGLDKFPQAFGLVQTALGIAISSGHPLLGFVRDVTGSYVIPFYVIGASVYMSAILLLFEPLVRRLQGKPTS